MKLWPGRSARGEATSREERVPGLGEAGEEVLKEPGPQHLSLSMLMASLFQPAGGPLVILPTCSQGPQQGLGQDLSQP